MILGHVFVDKERGTLDTHRDSYLLDTLTVVSVRRPLLAPSALLAGAAIAFSLSFGDLLFAHEIALLVCASIVLIFLGWQIGQLKLLSRDLRGSELSDAIWGRYGRLNAVRRQITSAMTSEGHAS